MHSAGKPYAGVEIKIINENNETNAINEIGEVCLKGKVIAQGYWNMSGVNEKYFRRMDGCIPEIWDIWMKKDIYF